MSATPRARGQARARGAHSRLVHAPGGPLAPEYRAIRKEHDLFSICRNADLCAEVTLQPVRRHGVDAAVMFADIMLPVLGMGLDVDLVEGVGPVVARPVDSAADVERLRVPDPEEVVPEFLAAISLVRAELGRERSVVGFCGGPFTVARYLIEGWPSRDFQKTKRLMYAEPAAWHGLMERLAETFAAYLVAQVRAGADVVQLFDSWVGALSVDDYREFVAPYSAQGPRRRSTFPQSTSAPERRTCWRTWRPRAVT